MITNDNEDSELRYFDFTTVFFHKRVHNMHDDDLYHRASVDRLDNGDCWVKCSCRPGTSIWKIIGGNDLAIQKSFERHLAGEDPCST